MWLSDGHSHGGGLSSSRIERWASFSGSVCKIRASSASSGISDDLAVGFGLIDVATADAATTAAAAAAAGAAAAVAAAARC